MCYSRDWMGTWIRSLGGPRAIELTTHGELNKASLMRCGSCCATLPRPVVDAVNEGQHRLLVRGLSEGLNLVHF
jgi:hypothetical protein